MATFIYPTNRELMQIGPALVARLSAGRVGLQIMPTRNVNSGLVQWNQKDNYNGLQQLRGLDGAPQHVNRVGSKTYTYNPGVYGEFQDITETELTVRAGSVLGNIPVDATDLVMAAQEHLTVRRLDRIESIIWTLLTTGTFSVSIGSTVVYTDTFTLQTASRAVVWSSLSTATPLADLRTVQLLSRGVGASFGSGATAYMNRGTANYLFNNTNSADLGGRRGPNGATINAGPQINSLLMGEDLPSIQIYDEGYINSSNTFVNFIPDGKVVIMGKRPDGQTVGEYVYTRNMVNPGGAPGPYMFTIDRTQGINGEKRVPPNIEVHDGHNGGPILLFPSSIVLLTVN